MALYTGQAGNTYAIAGHFAHLFVSSDGSTWLELAEMKNVNLQRQATPINANSNVDTTYEQVIQGRIKWSMTGSANYVDPSLTATGQGTVETQYAALSPIYVKLLVKAGTPGIGFKKWTGIASITDFSVQMQDGQPMSYNFTFEGRGALTAGAVASGDYS